MKRTLVIIPTFNEADNILKIIPEVLKNTTPENEFNILSREFLHVPYTVEGLVGVVYSEHNP